MIKVLFVCLGNICRSPMAEGIFEKLAQENGLSDVMSIDSAGTSAYHIGENPDSRTLEISKSHGVSIKHLGRQITIQDLEEFDYILAMDRNNYAEILSLTEQVKNFKAKIFTMRHFDPIKDNPDVPDPYWSGLDGFEEVYQILIRAQKVLLEYIKEEKQLNAK